MKKINTNITHWETYIKPVKTHCRFLGIIDIEYIVSIYYTNFDDSVDIRNNKIACIVQPVNGDKHNSYYAVLDKCHLDREGYIEDTAKWSIYDSKDRHISTITAESLHDKMYDTLYEKPTAVDILKREVESIIDTLTEREAKHIDSSIYLDGFVE